MLPVLSLTHISHSFGSEPILSDVTLTVQQGDFLGVVGPNGGGKTTLLRIMLGLLTPTKGSVTLFETKISSFRDWHRIGYIPQKVTSLTTMMPLTVEEIVGMNPLATKASIDEALSEVSMEEYKKRKIHELSGGQQQRIFIARALVSHPQLLILDEPTVGVDTQSQVQFYALLKHLNTKKGTTLILVSHDLDVVAHEVSTIACINKTLIAHCPPKEITDKKYFEKMYNNQMRFIVHNH